MPRRILQGTVVSDASDKTVVVRVERRFKHPVYKKFVTRTKKYAAHDEDNQTKVGDKVRIRECRPISKRKHWEVLTDSEAKTDAVPAAAGSTGLEGGGPGAAGLEVEGEVLAGAEA